MAARVGQDTPPVGAGTILTGQVTVTGSATQIVPARPGNLNQGRVGIIITNTGATDVYLGADSTVTTSTGDLLMGAKGSYVSIPSLQAVWAITGGASQVVTYMEVY